MTLSSGPDRSVAASGAPAAAVRLGIDPVRPELLGGKGASLADMIAAGFPVPDTAVVTADAYRSVAQHPSIHSAVARISASEDGAALSADEVDAIFAEAPIDEEVARTIVQVGRRVGDGGPVAVRSSATVEDLHGSSFAGQYRSLLDVDSSDAAALLTAVRAVWASLWHPAPAAYRRAFAIDEDEVAMAVVVMRMVPATSAGVVFTIDPGGSDGARVESVEGLGESLVSGRRTPAAWVVPRPGNEVGAGPDAQPDARSTVESPHGADGGPELPAAPARALELALAIEDHFGVPQDVEWAAVDDRVHVVQARPITVLEDQDGFDTPVDEHELTTAGIVEMVPGVLPALRSEINRFLLEEAFRSVLDSLGLIRGNTSESRPFVRRVRGRAAIDFDQLRDMAAGIPGAVAELERQYFGRADHQPSEAPVVGRQPGAGRLRRRITAVGNDLRALRTRRQVIDQADVLIKATAALRPRRPALEGWDDARLLAYLRRLIDLGARGLAAELGVAAAGAAAFQRLQLQLSRHLGEGEGPRATLLVTAGSGRAIDRTATASAAIFAGPTWLEIGASPPSGGGDRDGRRADRWPELQQRLRNLPGWTRRRILTGGFVDVRMRLVHRLVTDVTEQLHRREEAKAAFLELGGEARRVILELGRRLVETGAIEVPDDVELLTTEEIRRALDGEASISPDTLRRRRNWLTRYEAEGGLPLRFSGTPDREPEPLPQGDLLDGWAASPGRRQGRARVVRSSTDRIERGQVLVAEATDASWSPLFLRAGAVVVERGGPLSHAAILARELGLPAVLNVPGATRVLDGRSVTVDGDQGVVVIRSDEEVV